ncbi:MAG: sigma-70 family RNA polymerase sigma factor [Planctomycetaceae bacterium]
MAAAKTLETDLALLSDAKEFVRALLEGLPADPLLKSSWDEFYRIYTDLIRRFVVRQGVRGTDVDDCVQEVWHAVVRGLKDFRRPGRRPGLRAWLYRIVASVIADLFRSRSRAAAALRERIDNSETPVTSESGVERIQEVEWRRNVIETFLSHMRRRVSDENRRLMELRFLQGLSVDETAKILHLTREQVWYRQHRAVAKLKAWAHVYTAGEFRPAP